jgi:hypothetical protein
MINMRNKKPFIFGTVQLLYSTKLMLSLWAGNTLFSLTRSRSKALLSVKPSDGEALSLFNLALLHEQSEGNLDHHGWLGLRTSEEQ